MFRVQASHEAAILLRNALAAHAPEGRLWTNRHPGSDDFHLEIDQVAAAQLLQALPTTTTTRERHTPVTTTAQQETGTTDQEQYELLEAVVEALRRLK